jgi:hypothetical protein
VNIPVENFRGYIASIVAGVLAIGGPVALVFVWLQPADPTRDLSVIFAAIGAASGSASTFLFLQDSAARSSRATERAAEASSVQTRAASNGHTLAPLGVVNSQPFEHEYVPPAREAPLSAPFTFAATDADLTEGGDRFEGDVEPDQGEKHPDEPQEGLPEGVGELDEEPANQQRDS